MQTTNKLGETGHAGDGKSQVQETYVVKQRVQSDVSCCVRLHIPKVSVVAGFLCQCQSRVNRQVLPKGRALVGVGVLEEANRANGSERG